MLLLGTLSGLLAGTLYLTISVPLVLLMVDQEQKNAVGRSAVAAERVEQWLQAGEVLSPQRLQALGLVHHQVQMRHSGVVLTSSGPVAVELLEVCAEETKSAPHVSAAQTLGVTCRQAQNHRIVVATLPNYSPARRILYWTGLLALVVGIVTALGQARALSPLTGMARAVEQVGRGGRVTLASTGLAEFDALVERINEASQHVEDRVDAVTARITVVQEMARIVAHEVRNPLQSLELLTTLIADEPDADERRAIAASIRTEIRALDQVVHRLLREGSGTGALRLRRKTQSIAELVERTVSVIGVAAKRRGVVVSVGLLTREAADVDGTMLGRAIENLVKNAIEAVDDRVGEVRVSVHRDERDILVTVDDNGAGVPPELGERIFESDVSGRPDGHGLGLALVRAVLIAHGGTIEYSTSPLGGARFVARIPIEAGEEEHA